MEPAKPTPRALLLLLLATGLWGVGFVAVSNTLQVMHPLWSNAWRFVLAAPLALLLFRTRLVWDRAHQGAAAVAGACLALAFLFQTWGLQSTTVAKSSLITGLYCVVTPMMAPLFRAPLPTLTHGVGAVLAVVGLGVLSQVWDGGGTFNGGDALTLGCAVVSAVHIHVVAKVAPGRDALALNALQLMWTAVVSLVLAVVVAPAEYLVPPAGALGALLYLAVFCSVVAFGAQMRAQQEVSPTTASTVLLLEAPFGVLSGVVLLAEPLGGWQLLGGAMMVGGSLLSVRADTLRTVCLDSASEEYGCVGGMDGGGLTGAGGKPALEMPVCPACKAPLLNPAEPCPYCGAPTTGVAADLGTGAWIPMMQMPELAPASSDASPAFNVQLPIGTPRRVPGRAPAETALTPFEGLVYSLVDDVVGCEDVVAASGLARVDAATALERLAALGLITLGDTLAAPPHTQPDGFGTPRTEDTPKFVKTNSGSGLGVIPLKKMTAAEAAEQIPALIRAAKQAWGEGDLAEARDRLTKAHARDPDHEEVRNLHELLNAPHAAQLRAKALVDLGIKAERRRAMADAVMFYDRALNEFEPSAVLHHRVSLCMLHAGLPPREAVPHAQRALELVPGNPRYRELVDRLNAWKPA